MPKSEKSDKEGVPSEYAGDDGSRREDAARLEPAPVDEDAIIGRVNRQGDKKEDGGRRRGRDAGDDGSRRLFVSGEDAARLEPAPHYGTKPGHFETS